MQKIFKKSSARACVVLGRLTKRRGLASLLAFLLLTAAIQYPFRAMGSVPSDPYSLNLSWNSSPSPEVVGYQIYYGSASGVYTNILFLGNLTTATVPGLASGVTYYFAITAVNILGQESDFSNEAIYSQGIQSLQLSVLTDGQFILSISGTVGHTYDIEATQDFSDWTVIGTVTVDGSDSVNFTDPNAGDFPRHFYRTRDTLL